MRIQILKDELYPHYIMENEWNGGISGRMIDITEDELKEWRMIQSRFYEWRDIIEERYEASSDK
jgi:hypothetical protein